MTQDVLDAASFDADEVILRCVGGEILLMRLAGSSIVAAVTELAPTTISGTVVHTYNVFDAMASPVGAS